MAVNRLALYKKLGIELGPEDKTRLTRDQAKEELRKLKAVGAGTGFLYFLMEYVTVPHTSLGQVRLRDNMFKWQAQAAQDFVKYRSIISKKSRQCSNSVMAGAYALWRALLFEAQVCSIVSLSQRESSSLLRKTKFMYDHLPPWIKQPTSEFAKTSITFKQTGSVINSLPNNSDPARGESLSLLILDEFSKYDHAADVLAAAGPTMAAGALSPFTDTSLPSQMFIISTLPRNPVDNEYLRLLHGAQEGKETKFHLLEIETDDIPWYMDEAWHKEMLEMLGPRLYAIEIQGREVYDMENAALPGAVLERLGEGVHNPIRVDFLRPEDIDAEGYYVDMDKITEIEDDFDPDFLYIKGLWFWKDPELGREYAVIADVSTGRAEDFSGFVVMDLDSAEQVAEYKGKVNTEVFKRVIELVCAYYGNAKLSIENQGLGAPVAEHFGTGIGYENFYWHKYNGKKISPGIPMSTVLRAHAISYLIAMATKGDFCVRSVRLMNELRSFGYSRTGRVEALAGNDDLVMCLAQYCYLVVRGWAVSDSQSREANVFGADPGLESADDGSELAAKPLPPALKYYDEKFDVDVQLGEEDRANLETMRGDGYTVPADELYDTSDGIFSPPRGL